MHDLDRIRYVPAFAALAGKTQVVASMEMGGFHTRLTHTLKVAQLGRRIAELLRPGDGSPGPDPDLVEAACLAHDIGHPPFGHAGERALRDTYVELAASSGDGFEGNAQNLRILTHLSARKTENHRGLHLTRAALDATMKYPWKRDSADPYRKRKFGVYRQDADAADWVLLSGMLDRRPVEEQIMDWADEVTYACHDVEDFYRAGLIPLDTLLALKGDQRRRRQIVESDDLADFLDDLKKRWTEQGTPFDRERILQILLDISNLAMVPTGPYNGSYNDKTIQVQMTSRLIGYFLSGLELETTDDSALGLTRYRASLKVPEDKKLASKVLSALIWYYVIDRPELASQQHGQAHIVSELFRWHAAEPERLLPVDRREELQADGDPHRTACDHIASLTEPQALTLFQRMSGVATGSITDRFR